MVQTKVADIIDPEVIGNFLPKKMIDNLVLAPLADIDTTLVNRPGSTLTVPQWNYIGMAEDLAEGEALTTVKLTASESTVTVKKAVKAVELTDEAVLSGYGNPINETVNQLAISIAQKIDADFIAEIRKLTPLTDVKIDPAGYHWVLDAQVAFGEDFNEETFLFISPKNRANILKSNDFVHIDMGSKIITGELGSLYGMRIVISNQIAEDEAFVIKRGALKLVMKRGYTVEDIRKGETRSTIISADQHYIAYVADATKVKYIKGTVTP